MKPKEASRKPTEAELAIRVDICRAMLASGAYDGEVKRAVAKHFGISQRTDERYLRRARDIIVAESGNPLPNCEPNRWSFTSRCSRRRLLPFMRG